MIEPDDITSSCGLRVLISRGGITFAAASSGLAPIQVVASESDVRTLPVRFDPRGERPCAFADAGQEHALHDFPIQGPWTTHWLLLEIARSELGPVARHHWWKQAMGLSSSDPGVDEHLFLCEMLGHGTQHDQLNLPDLVLCGAVSRRLQLWEERHAEKFRACTAGGVSAGHATERRRVLGGSRPKGSALVAPELEKLGCLATCRRGGHHQGKT